VAHGGRVLAPCLVALRPEVLSCRRGVRRQRLNVVGHGGRDADALRHGDRVYDGRCIFLENFYSSIYFSKIKEKIYKKIPSSWLAGSWLAGTLQKLALGFNQGYKVYKRPTHARRRGSPGSFPRRSDVNSSLQPPVLFN
jgi:hypothetical protein